MDTEQPRRFGLLHAKQSSPQTALGSQPLSQATASIPRPRFAPQQLPSAPRGQGSSLPGPHPGVRPPPNAGAFASPVTPSGHGTGNSTAAAGVAGQGVTPPPPGGAFRQGQLAPPGPGDRPPPPPPGGALRQGRLPPPGPGGRTPPPSSVSGQGRWPTPDPGVKPIPPTGAWAAPGPSCVAVGSSMGAAGASLQEIGPPMPTSSLGQGHVLLQVSKIRSASSYEVSSPNAPPGPSSISQNASTPHSGAAPQGIAPAPPSAGVGPVNPGVTPVTSRGVPTQPIRPYPYPGAPGGPAPPAASLQPGPASMSRTDALSQGIRPPSSFGGFGTPKFGLGQPLPTCPTFKWTSPPAGTALNGHTSHLQSNLDSQSNPHAPVPGSVVTEHCSLPRQGLTLNHNLGTPSLLPVSHSLHHSPLNLGQIQRKRWLSLGMRASIRINFHMSFLLSFRPRLPSAVVL